MLRDRIRAGQFGAIVTPAAPFLVDGLPVWAADNACGPGRRGNGASYPGDGKWISWLVKMAPHAARCLFAVVPDVVCDAPATLARFADLATVPRALGYPVALAAQNGLEPAAVPWSRVDVLFIGGDDAYKTAPSTVELAREALTRGKGLHMGRVNGGDRYAFARALGCHTADGTCINIAPD